MSKGSRSSIHEVMVEYLTNGLPGVVELDKAKELTRTTLRGAMKELHDRDADFEALERWCRKKYGFGLNNRQDARGPKMGDEREYKVQGTKNAPFVKLPLRTLGAKPGGTVKVAFLESKLVTTPA